MAWLLPPERDIGVLRAPVRSTLILLGLFLLELLAFGLLERLGIEAWMAPIGVIAGAVAVFIIAALLSHSRRAIDFYVADRRTSAPFGGLAVAGCLAGLLTIGLTGGGYGSYDDFLVMAAGLVTGLLFLGFTIAPRLRSVGGYSAGDYLAFRFGGGWVRFIYAIITFAVSFLLLLAQLKITAPILATVIGLTPHHALYAAAGVTVLAVLPGGMRSLTWTQAIQYFVVLAACLVPAGSLIMRGAGGDMAVSNEFAMLLKSTIPRAETIGRETGTVLPFLMAAFGGTALPFLTVRALTAGSERGAVTTMTWAALYAAILVVVGLFLALLFEEVGDWTAAGGLLQIAALFATLPAVLAGLVLAGALAALFAVGMASLFAAATAVSHDIWDEIIDKHGTEGRRIIIARLLLVAVAASAAALVPILNVEPAVLLRWALALAASGGLAPLLIGLAWRRAIDIGAIAGMVAGFGFTGLAFVLQQTGLFGGAAAGGIAAMGAPMAGVSGLAIALVVTIGVSIVLPAPEPEAEEPAEAPGAAHSDQLPIRERPA